jgi:outer membrane receptor protein involved in Fe transport
MNKPNKFLMTVGSTVIGFAVVNVSPSVSANTLDEVVVTGSREGTEIRNTPATIHKVTEKELARDKPVFFGDVVNRVPGVYVNNLGAEQHMASFRQPINTQGVYLYLEDGVPVRPIGLFNHNQVYELNLTGISDIEIIKGPASSLY